MDIVQLLQMSNFSWGPSIGDNDRDNHQWISCLLADLVSYSEDNHLDEVGDILAEALEKIAPLVANHDENTQAATFSHIARPENVVLLRA
ncbi:hypothetical protein AXZ77_0811 [Thioclava sp. ES.031]|uniref:hypothetical protein n=1 Tax=Thioclava sp. ES.031 TaxID=1798203 RepID=UPI000C01B760|nr:hypothetical protein [Thioclava sp. ES.031]PFG62233.1 hypothetical protein AXZ77_0811 [Thioclava sp. ES.031]